MKTSPARLCAAGAATAAAIVATIVIYHNRRRIRDCIRTKYTNLRNAQIDAMVDAVAAELKKRLEK